MAQRRGNQDASSNVCDTVNAISKSSVITKHRMNHRGKTMPNEIATGEDPKFDISKASETEAEKRLDRAAEEAAEKAEKTEQNYDQGHGIFTK
jgi:hypothetical protein